MARPAAAGLALALLSPLVGAISFAGLNYTVLAPLPGGVREDFVDTGGNITAFTATSGKDGSVSFDLPSYRADFLENALGTAAPLTGWAVASFDVGAEDAGALRFIRCSNVGAFSIDGAAFVGDQYAWDFWFSSTAPDTSLEWPVRLAAGTHTLRVRFGGPFWRCQQAEGVAADPSPRGGLFLQRADSPYAPSFNPGVSVIAPDVVNGTLAGGLLSVPVGNAAAETLSNGSVRIVAVTPPNAGLAAAAAAFPPLAPGQVFPVTVQLTASAPLHCVNGSLKITIEFRATDSSGRATAVPAAVPLRCVAFPGHWFRFTFASVSGTAQFAMARPPAAPAGAGGAPLPLVVSTHGAGVDAGSVSWTNAYQAQPRAWLLLPSGDRAFGFDWQGPARMSALLAVRAFVSTLPGVPHDQRAQYAARDDRVLFAGHSMGGHGCLLLSSAFADAATGSLCAAGWIKMWQYQQTFANAGTSFAGARLRGVLQAAVAGYETDLYAPHLAAGTPMKVRMGGADDNVCPWNLRRYARVVTQLRGNTSAAVPVSEIPGQPHWWGGIVDDAEMQAFLSAHATTDLPAITNGQWEVVATALFGTGRGGIKIVQQRTPLQPARVHAQIRGSLLVLRTQNARRLALSAARLAATAAGFAPSAVVIDGAKLPPVDSTAANGYTHYERAARGAPWAVARDGAFAARERSELTSSPLVRVLDGRVTVVHGDSDATGAAQATLLANRLIAQLHAGARVLPAAAAAAEVARTGNGYNWIVIGGPERNAFAADLLANRTACTLAGRAFADGGAVWVGQGSRAQGNGSALLALGALLPFVGPPFLGADGDGLSAHARGTSGLVALVAGVGDAGQRLAFDMFPAKSNVEVPDFVVATEEARWRGAGGFVSAGFWANDWGYDPRLAWDVDPE